MRSAGPGLARSKFARFAYRIALLAGGLAAASFPASAQSVSYVGGLQYATGNFVFARPTWSAYLWNGLSWSGGRTRASASIPLVAQPAGWLRYSGAGIAPTGGMGAASRNSANNRSGTGMHTRTMMSSNEMTFPRVGIGDPVGRIDFGLLGADSSHPALSLVTMAKAPLAGLSHGFGTGEWDFGAGLSSTMRLGQVSVFGDAVYWKLGNPKGDSLRNAVVYSVSIGRIFTNGDWSLLGTVSGASSLASGLEAPAQVGLGGGRLLRSGSTIFATVAAGLTQTAPAVSMGLGWRVPLGRQR